MKKELWVKFKSLTGYKGTDIANMVNVSRQHVSYLTVRDPSITNRSAVVLWMDMLIDEKINSMEMDIANLKQLKTEIRESVLEFAEVQS